MKRECEKRVSAERVGGRGGVPGEALESAKMKESTESAKRLERPVPCKQGAADLKASPHAADPRKSNLI